MTEPVPSDELTPRQIVAELDRYIVGQEEAKKAVAIAIRNRWRRRRVDEDLRDEIVPSNLVLIGPTGVGKTEVARRLARLAGAPFVKVEASKFTEVGYVGRDVESLIRDLAETSVNMVRAEREEEMGPVAEERVEERLLDLLLPDSGSPEAAKKGAGDRPDRGAGGGASGGGSKGVPVGSVFVAGPGGVTPRRGESGSSTTGAGGGSGTGSEEAGSTAAGPGGEEGGAESIEERRRRTREKLRGLLKDGKLEDREVEVEVQQQANIEGLMMPMGGMEGMDQNLQDMLQDMLPKKTKRRTVTVAEARRILLQDELDRLVDMDEVTGEALERAQESGIVFLDEIDKVTAKEEGGGRGPDVSREGVQRDLLPIVEGSNVQTKHGMVRTDHILFIAAGAFHVARPSDLIPELQGRFPIRVELQSLGEDDFVRILREPRNALTNQYRALTATEGTEVEFTDEGVQELARIATELNDRMENIGARRLQTVMTTLLEDTLYNLPEERTDRLVVDREFVQQNLDRVVEDEDLRRYIL